MDLLRLVFCYQGVNRILSLPKLSKDTVFLAMRSKVRDYELTKNLVRSTTFSGEISVGSRKYIFDVNLCDRALFLQDITAFRQLARKVSHGLDFWLCIESGIPEIQAEALARPGRCSPKKSHHHSKRRRGHRGGVDKSALRAFNDLNAISWTPQLRTAVAKFLPPDNDDLDELYGFLGVSRIPSSPSGDYYIGACKRALNGEETLEKNEELQSICDNAFGGVGAGTVEDSMISGYLYPILDSLNTPDETTKRCAVRYASRLALKIILRTSTVTKLRFPKRAVTTRWYRRRVEAVLHDEELVEKLPEKIVKWYRAVAYGECYPELAPDTAFLGSFDGYVNFAQADNDFLDLDKKSLQGIAFRDPRGLLKKMGRSFFKHDEALRRDSFRKGDPLLGTCYPSSDSDSDGSDEESAPDPAYAKILTYLKGETETLKP